MGLEQPQGHPTVTLAAPRVHSIEWVLEGASPRFRQHFPHAVYVEKPHQPASDGFGRNGRHLVGDWCRDQFGPASRMGETHFTWRDRWSSFGYAFFFAQDTDATAFKMRWG